MTTTNESEQESSRWRELARNVGDLLGDGGAEGDLDAPRVAELQRLLEQFGESGGDGARFLGPYLLGAELGRGGQGVVYLAEDRRLGRRVALKTIDLGLVGAEDARRRLEREAELTARIDHPAVCPIYDVGEDDGRVYIAMRYVEGETLAAKLSRVRRAHPATTESFLDLATSLASTPVVSIDRDAVDAAARVSEGPPSADRTPVPGGVAEVVTLVREIALALDDAHEAGLIHRDIKPANVMISETGKPVILDFGLARLDDPETPLLTRTGVPVGTPAYMSPEQIEVRHRDVDRRTDVYSLGVTLYELLTLRRPFEEATREALYRAILSDPAPDARSLNASISKDLALVLETALQKDVDARYQSAALLAADLGRLLASERVLARRPSALARLTRWSKRNRALAATTLGLFLALAGGLAVAVVLLGARDRAIVRMGRLTTELDTALTEVTTRNRELAASERGARAAQLASEARRLASLDPNEALQLALVSHQMDPSPEALDAMRAAMDRDDRLYSLPFRVDAALFHPDGERLLVTVGNELKIWDLAARSEEASYPLELEGPFDEIRCSPHGRVVALIDAMPNGRERAVVWATDPPRPIATLEADRIVPDDETPFVLDRGAIGRWDPSLARVVSIHPEEESDSVRSFVPGGGTILVVDRGYRIGGLDPRDFTDVWALEETAPEVEYQSGRDDIIRDAQLAVGVVLFQTRRDGEVLRAVIDVSTGANRLSWSTPVASGRSGVAVFCGDRAVVTLDPNPGGYGNSLRYVALEDGAVKWERRVLDDSVLCSRDGSSVVLFTANPVDPSQAGIVVLSSDGLSRRWLSGELSGYRPVAIGRKRALVRHVVSGETALVELGGTPAGADRRARLDRALRDAEGVVQAADGLALSFDAEQWRALDLESGEVLWTCATPAATDVVATTGSPVFLVRTTEWTLWKVRGLCPLPSLDLAGSAPSLFHHGRRPLVAVSTSAPSRTRIVDLARHEIVDTLEGADHVVWHPSEERCVGWRDGGTEIVSWTRGGGTSTLDAEMVVELAAPGRGADVVWCGANGLWVGRPGLEPVARRIQEDVGLPRALMPGEEHSVLLSVRDGDLVSWSLNSGEGATPPASIRLRRLGDVAFSPIRRSRAVEGLDLRVRLGPLGLGEERHLFHYDDDGETGVLVLDTRIGRCETLSPPPLELVLLAGTPAPHLMVRAPRGTLIERAASPVDEALRRVRWTLGLDELNRIEIDRDEREPRWLVPRAYVDAESSVGEAR